MDFDTYKATMVGLPLCGGGSPVLEVVSFRKKAGDDAAYEALRRIRFLLATSSLAYQGDVFFLERGWGAQRKADYMMGAFFGAIFAFLSGHSATNVMTAQEWKKKISAACGVMTKDKTPGNGALTKEEAHIYVRQVAAAAGHTRDIISYGPDALDAYAIAVTGKWLNTAAASAMIGGVQDESNSRAFVEDAVLRGAAGGVATQIPEGGN